MRIISGDLKGKVIENLSNSTHPMSEKIRGGLFNILGDISGLTILDCFAGTGAISFEAISRGAKSAMLVESNKKAQKSIANNIKKLELGSATKLIGSSVSSFISHYAGENFDLIICDPPFDKPINTDEIIKLEKMLKPDALLVLSLPITSINLQFESLLEIKEKTYGDARLVFFRRKI